MKKFGLFFFLIVFIQCGNKIDCNEETKNSFEISKIYFIRDSVFVDNDSKIKLILTSKIDYLNEYIRNNGPANINICFSTEKFDINQRGILRRNEKNEYLEIITDAPIYHKNNNKFFSNNRKIFQSMKCLNFSLGENVYSLKKTKPMKYSNFEQGVKKI